METTKQLKKDFSFILSRLSHEIRNPIALISSELQLMADSHPELCSYRQWDSLMDNLDYVKELLNELSDFSHSQTVNLVPTDPKEFLTAIFNLIRNSCEAISYPGGKITVGLRKINDRICISIKDNGCGMTETQTANIFQPFVTYKSEGTGLGLAVTSEIMAAHHGQIKVTSTPKQGTTFSLYLPCLSEI